MELDDPITGLSLGRVVIGLGSFAAPDVAAKVFGLSPDDNEHLPYMTRMFAAREVAIGAITMASKGAARRKLALVGMAIDGSDAVTGALELTAKRIPTLSGAMLIGVAGSAVAAGAVGYLRARD